MTPAPPKVATKPVQPAHQPRTASAKRIDKPTSPKKEPSADRFTADSLLASAFSHDSKLLHNFSAGYYRGQAGRALVSSASRLGNGNGGSSGSPANTSNAYLDAQFSHIRNRLSEHLCYPIIARKRGWFGKVVVSFIINMDGNADKIEIHESCGISLLDQSVIKTVRNACPFPIPPMTAQIIIPILYNLN